MSDQNQWTQARELIEPFTGPVSSVRQAGDGFNSQIAVIINERYFVKGLRQDHPRVWTQNREKQINPHIRHLSADLEWHAESDAWNILGFRYITGRKADYSPASPDLAAITAMMTRLPLAPADLDLKLAEQRWSSYSDRPSLFAGQHLSHTDWSPGNVLIAGDARLIDWAWPTRGAAWIDPACWTVWLIACGHHPAQAEDHAAQVPAFARAPAPAITAFAAAQAAMWADIADHAPHPGLAAAATAWHEYRTDTTKER
ncbi:MAG: aminoglycoside phosphotransferase [Sciscionella sp.]